MSITAKEFFSLSPQDRQFYLDNKDEIEMLVINGKLHYKVQSGPCVTWQRFKELLKLEDSLTEQERNILRIYTDFNDWNRFSRPYIDHGLHYFLNIDISSYRLKQEGITQNVKEWLCEWLLAHGFTQDDVTRIRYTGGIGGCGEFYENYGIETRCNFKNIPPHYIPQKVHDWAKRNKKYRHLIFRKEEQ